MTLFEIEILMHHHVSPTPFPRANARGYPPTVKKLYALNLLTIDGMTDDEVTLYKTTARGIAFIAALEQLPLPQAVNPTWAIPGFGEMLGQNNDN